MPTITLSMGLELLLSTLLAATLIYCIVLERRLAAVRQGQTGLKKMIGDLNTAIVNAGASLRALKSAAGEAAETLDERLKRARGLSDELSLLTASGERIAQRFESRPEKTADAGQFPSNSVMTRLNTLKAVR